MSNTSAARIEQTPPRFIRAKYAHGYLGMCRDEFNKTVRPHVREFPIGKQGVAFDRHDLDDWADLYIHATLAGQRPMLTKLEEKKSSRKPYPMSWEEQSILFAELPGHLQTMALFKVNTGCREQEVCKLRWDWEISAPELGTSVFLISADFGGRHARSGVKNGDERLVVLNTVAKSIIEKQRGVSREWVFPYNGTAMHRMNDSAWKKARVRATKLWQDQNLRPVHPGYASIRVHDLKHTFGRRLSAAGVTEEDRKSLLGHKNGSITSHYSGAELGKLIEAANMVSTTDSRGPVLTILKRKIG
jgi:integrase